MDFPNLPLNSIKPERCSSDKTDNLKLILSTIVCDTCKQIPIKPLKTKSESHHYYCLECIKKSINFQEIKDKLIMPSILEIKLLETMDICCGNQALGCDKNFNYIEIKNLIQHEGICDYSSVKCVNKQCNFKCFRKDIAKHEANCEFSMIECERCLDIIEKSKMTNHDCIKSLHRLIKEIRKENELKLIEIEMNYLSKLNVLEEEIMILKDEINVFNKEKLNLFSSSNKNCLNQNFTSKESEADSNINKTNLISKVNQRINSLENEVKLMRNQIQFIESSRNKIESTLTEEKLKGTFQSNENQLECNYKGLYVNDREENKALLSSIEKKQFCKNGLTNTIDENLSSSFLNERDPTMQNLRNLHPKPIRGYFQEFFKLDIFKPILNKVKEIVLLFRASEHNFLGKKFHEYCDGKPHNIIFIKSETGNIFGGYTPLKWHSVNNVDVGDDTMSGFLFSITYNTKHPHYNFRDKAIHCYNTFGPIFGGREGSRDLVIYDECNKNRKSHSNLGYSYKLLDGMVYGSDKAREYLGGTTKFKVIEYEVYQLIY